MKDLGTSSSTLTAPSNGEQAAEQVRPITWARDKSDYSWVSRDANNTMFRVTDIYISPFMWRWVFAWQEQDGLRISSRTFLTAQDAMSAAEELWSLVPAKMELAI